MARVEIAVETCKGCELCVVACPRKCLGKSRAANGKGYYPAAVAEPDKCTGCAMCALVCPDVAISVWR
ncbi:MAG: 4Fe-4S binding protein [Firmicutes bacterium]|nr:4Fe-4S binding protein [Bacillota bacterium]